MQDHTEYLKYLFLCFRCNKSSWFVLGSVSWTRWMIRTIVGLATGILHIAYDAFEKTTLI